MEYFAYVSAQFPLATIVCGVENSHLLPWPENHIGGYLYESKSKEVLLLALQSQESTTRGREEDWICMLLHRTRYNQVCHVCWQQSRFLWCTERELGDVTLHTQTHTLPVLFHDAVCSEHPTDLHHLAPNCRIGFVTLIQVLLQLMDGVRVFSFTLMGLIPCLFYELLQQESSKEQRKQIPKYISRSIWNWNELGNKNKSWWVLQKMGGISLPDLW